MRLKSGQAAISFTADPEFRVYGSYGVETSWPRLLLSMAKPSFYVDWVRSLRHRFWGGIAWQMAKMPADFLIGPDGRIVTAHYGRDIGDHLAVPRIEAYLDELERHGRRRKSRANQCFPVLNRGGSDAVLVPRRCVVAALGTRSGRLVLLPQRLRDRRVGRCAPLSQRGSLGHLFLAARPSQLPVCLTQRAQRTTSGCPSP